MLCRALSLLLLVAAAASEDNTDTEKSNTDGKCSYLDYDAGISMAKLNPQCNGKCSVSGTAKNEYDCMNSGDPACCKWDNNELLAQCTKVAVQNALYIAADTCCDEASESCSDDGWPKSCNLGCAAVMVPLMNKCVSTFPSLGLTASVAPLQTATKLCPCSSELMACDQEAGCDKALDSLPDLTVPEYKEFFTGNDGSGDHFNDQSKPSAVKTALYNCYVKQNYPTTDPLDPGGH